MLRRHLSPDCAYAKNPVVYWPPRASEEKSRTTGLQLKRRGSLRPKTRSPSALTIAFVPLPRLGDSLCLGAPVGGK
jgi:hypothetical protein